MAVPTAERSLSSAALALSIAAWVGMFATALNLLPGGQLDGGHIVFALNPGAHRRISRMAIIVLIPLGIYFWFGWFVWAVLLWVSGLRHPSVPTWPDLSKRRRATSLLALLLLLLTLAPAPFEHASGRDVADDFKALIHMRLHR